MEIERIDPGEESADPVSIMGQAGMKTGGNGAGRRGMMG